MFVAKWEMRRKGSVIVYCFFFTYRVTVLLGSRLGSGGSDRSSLLQLTLLPTAWTPWLLERSSVQLQPPVDAMGPGQTTCARPGSKGNTNRSSISTRRAGMPHIVLGLDVTSAAPPPPVIIPYLQPGARSATYAVPL